MNPRDYQQWQHAYQQQQQPNMQSSQGHGQYTPQHGQPLIVIPQRSPAELQQYYPSQSRDAQGVTHGQVPTSQHQIYGHDNHSPHMQSFNPLPQNSQHYAQQHQFIVPSQSQQYPSYYQAPQPYQQMQAPAMHSPSPIGHPVRKAPQVPSSSAPHPRYSSHTQPSSHQQSSSHPQHMSQPQHSSQPRHSDSRPHQSSSQKRPTSTPQPPAQKRQSSSQQTSQSPASKFRPEVKPKIERSSDDYGHPMRDAPVSSRQPQPKAFDQASHQAKPSPKPLGMCHQGPPMRPAVPPIVNQTHSDGLLGKVATPTLPAVDHQALLITLAEEYIDNAHSLSALIARSRQQRDVDEYYQSLSTGLRCLGSAIKQIRPTDPRTDARLRLRYAYLLFDETENDPEARDILGKGITTCERNRLTDLKNSMQHLLARVLFKDNPRAALKMIDAVISDLEAYQQIAWLYAFRFLRVSFSLQFGKTADNLAALQHLNSITTSAERRRDAAVLNLASILEAIVHLRTGHGSGDSRIQAQRALATARSHQLQSSVQDVPQLMALINVVDLACELTVSNVEQAQQRLQTMQATMDQSQDSKWSTQVTFLVSTSLPASADLDQDADGILRRDGQGNCALVFDWLKRIELYSIGYLLSGISVLQKDCVGEKAEKYLQSGLKLTKEVFRASDDSRQSLKATYSTADRGEVIRGAIQLILVFVECNRSNWTSARELLNKIDSANLNQLTQELRYLDGMIYQGAGDLKAALAAYKSPILALAQGPARRTGADLDYRLLALLNIISILRTSTAHKEEVEGLVQAVEAHCKAHPNQGIVAAFNMLRATAGAEVNIIQMKSYLQTSLRAANHFKNQQLLALTMNVMSARLFEGIVGEQAEKSTKTGVALAKRARNPVLEAAAGDRLSKTLELSGKKEQAQKAKEEALGVMDRLPEKVKQQL